MSQYSPLFIYDGAHNIYPNRPVVIHVHVHNFRLKVSLELRKDGSTDDR